MTATIESGYAPVNGLHLYFERHGSGDPLVMLHGGLGSTAMFDQITPILAETRQVITVDLHGHGRTADSVRPLRYPLMADDIAGLMQHLQLDQADILGYSLGGGTALQTTIRHPKMIRKLILLSTPFQRNGWYPEVLTGMAQMGVGSAEMMKQSPIYQHYVSVAPKPEDWPTLHVKIHDLLTEDYDWTQDVSAIKTPTMLVYADADSIRPAQMVEFYCLLGGGQKDAGWDGAEMPRARLAILPGMTHYNILTSPILPPIVVSFLNESISTA